MRDLKIGVLLAHRSNTESRTRGTAEQDVNDIRRATRKHHAAEEKIRIVLEGLPGEYSLFGATAPCCPLTHNTR